MLAGAGLLALPSALAQSGGSADDGRKVLIACAALAVVGVIAVLVALKVRPPRTWPVKLRFMFYRAALALRRMRARPIEFVGAILLATTLQAALLGVNVLLGAGMGLVAPWSTWLFAWTLAKLVAMLPISFGVFGVSEASFAVSANANQRVPFCMACGIGHEVSRHNTDGNTLCH